MTLSEQIDAYIEVQAPRKRQDLRDLHQRILTIAPDAKLWFLDGRDDIGKVVTNPNIGYGVTVLSYANGTTRSFYKVGLSANTSGISVFVMGLADKAFLAKAYGPRLGKAKVTSYCIRFRSLADIDPRVLGEVFADALTQEKG